MSLGANYVIGDVETVPNPRNALGDNHRWLWYKHLSQHPLVSPVHRANLSGMTNTLVVRIRVLSNTFSHLLFLCVSCPCSAPDINQIEHPIHKQNTHTHTQTSLQLCQTTTTQQHTGTHDRLLDDNRLYAHRLGLANPDRLTRIEVYKDMVHVHHVMSVFSDAHVATANVARFIARSKHLQEQQHQRGVGIWDADAEDAQRQKENRSDTKEGGVEAASFLHPNMIRNRTLTDNVEWVLVEHGGKEVAKDDGWPMSVLLKVWPPVELFEV